MIIWAINSGDYCAYTSFEITALPCSVLLGTHSHVITVTVAASNLHGHWRSIPCSCCYISRWIRVQSLPWHDIPLLKCCMHHRSILRGYTWAREQHAVRTNQIIICAINSVYVSPYTWFENTALPCYVLFGQHSYVITVTVAASKLDGHWRCIPCSCHKINQWIDMTFSYWSVACIITAYCAVSHSDKPKMGDWEPINAKFTIKPVPANSMQFVQIKLLYVQSTRVIIARTPPLKSQRFHALYCLDNILMS